MCTIISNSRSKTGVFSNKHPVNIPAGTPEGIGGKPVPSAQPVMSSTRKRDGRKSYGEKEEMGDRACRSGAGGRRHCLVVEPCPGPGGAGGAKPDQRPGRARGH